MGNQLKIIAADFQVIHNGGVLLQRGTTMPTIEDDKIIALKLANKLGHEMKDWSWEDFNRWHWCHCRLCGRYLFVRGGHRKNRGVQPYDWQLDERIGGPAIKRSDRRCWGVASRGKRRRRYTIKKRKIMVAYQSGGINAVIKHILGEYPE